MDEKQLQVVMSIIIKAGEVRSKSLEAVEYSLSGDYKMSDKCFQEAQQLLLEAHHAQTDLLSKEANKEKIDLNLLTIHSQDHLMTSITVNDLAKKMVKLSKKLQI
ncbi:PTS lactose/cellobiose transporter subunit IIA [Streptococcus castoreus]|uniref:PTS lactose/cellobiose transporter subunit IIA n=1 Tax=Streptococcus castoreus TaxID=254786 RepID=UPI0003FF345E|nr:PTS lactose/cellobiose transporter subunit IIA [Streptococcus castoreus]